MKYAALTCVFFLAAAASAQDATLKEARERWLRGNYAEAEELYGQLAKNPRDRAAATIGLSRTLASTGDYTQAIRVVETALTELPKDASLLARHAETLYQTGRWDEAEKAANQAIALEDENFLARWIRGQIYRDRGELTKADEEFRWFIRTYSQRSFNDMEITDPDLLVLVGLAGSERARWHNLQDQFQFILNEVFLEATKKDKSFWPGEYQAGALFLEKYNKASAVRSFDKVLTINPRAAEAFAGKGFLAMQRFEIKDADQLAERALEINPHLPDALRLKADVHIFSGEIDAALKVLEQARKINGREETTLARITACHYLAKDAGKLDAIIKEVEKQNPRAGMFYYELADQLDGQKFMDDAEKYFRRAIELRPKLPYAFNGLGLLCMRMGREEEAREILTRAFDFDSFNVRVHNSLQVLDHLKSYTTLKTEHFHLRYDADNDKVLAAFMAKYLEEIYEELATMFAYRPKGPILIEIFNRHDMFSGRVVALPDLHTIGACTGRMVGMVSPREKSGVVGEPFNWARVLRHELVHVFNLEQTKFRVPHWFTEGLAVRNEGFPPPPAWQTILAERVADNDLMNLDNILLGFIRPKSAEQWQQAYLQSLLYVEYLDKTHGPKAISGLLAAYTDDLNTDAALRKVCGVGKLEFEKGYLAFLKERVKQSGARPAEKVLTFKELKEQNKQKPDDLDVQAQLAERYLSIGNSAEATRLTDDVLAAKKTHPLAAYVKARLLLKKGLKDDALRALEAGVDTKDPNEKVLKFLARMQIDRGKVDDAARTCELGRRFEPYETSWLTELARIYNLTGDEGKLIDVLKDLCRHSADELPGRRRLAKLLQQRGQHADAERYAREALEIDVLDTDAQRTLENALESQGKNEELRQLRQLLKS